MICRQGVLLWQSPVAQMPAFLLCGIVPLPLALRWCLMAAEALLRCALSEEHAPVADAFHRFIGHGLSMLQYMDPLIYTYGVDLWLSGHVHTYERRSV